MKKIVISMLCCLILFTVNADAVEFKEEKNISVFKPFTIKFNKNINPLSINNNNIYVTDSQGNKISTIIRLEGINHNTQNKIVVYPSDQFETNTVYTLHILPEIKSLEGRSLKEEVIKNFTTEEIIKNPKQENNKEISKKAKSIKEDLKDQKKLQYTYDKIELIIDGEFTAKPIELEEESWLTKLAGGKEESLQIVYGRITLDEKDDNNLEFIQIIGKNGSDSLISNSGSYKYYDNTNILKQSKIQFTSSKMIEGNTIIKDYTKTDRAIVMYREFEENSKEFFTSIFEIDSENFWHIEKPKDNFYQAVE